MASAFAKAVPAEPIGPTELAIPIIESVPDYFKPGGTQEFIQSVAAYCGSQQLSVDSDEERDKIRSLAYKVTKTKTAMTKIVDDWAREQDAIKKSVKKEAAHLEGELSKIATTTRKPLTDYENYDKERIAEHETALGQIFNACLFVGAPSIESIQQRMAQIRTLEGRNWEEYRDRAAEGVAESIASLKAMLAKAELAEAERIEAEATKAELAALKAQMAARERLAETAPELLKQVTPAAFTAVSMQAKPATQEEIIPPRPTPGPMTQEKAEAAIYDALTGPEIDLDPDQATDVVTAIRDGQIPFLKIVF